jgi:hypothetical protein
MAIVEEELSRIEQSMLVPEEHEDHDNNLESKKDR